MLDESEVEWIPGTAFDAIITEEHVNYLLKRQERRQRIMLFAKQVKRMTDLLNEEGVNVDITYSDTDADTWLERQLNEQQQTI